jgi:SIR2-like domain
VPGRLFVVRSDLTQLACDAWLVPADKWLTVEAPWAARLPGQAGSRESLGDAGPAGFGSDTHTFPLDAGEGRPIPFITNVGGVGLERLPARVLEFLERADGSVTASRVPGRKNPLFAFPLVGTGYGGWSEAQGELTRTVVTAVSEWVAKHEADAVLVSWTPQAFAAAHSQLRRVERADTLQPMLVERATWLGRQAALGRLVLFLGAGLGVSAGLPLWQELLRLLAVDAGITDDEAQKIMKLDPLDAARIIEARLGGDPEWLGMAIAEHVGRAERFGLGHALLASLPVSEAVTTNYDTLFERAVAAAGRKLAVLPYDPPRGDGWLLKLHGCAERRPTDIVLTRGDYLRYADRRAALAGIVQALLITREMLFVGFSLTDENFFRIADDVRKAVRGPAHTEKHRFGTALLVQENPLLSELWADDLECLTMADEAREGGRNLELFLDRMLASASTGAQHLLDPAFAGALDDGEAALSHALQQFHAGIPEAARATPAWAVIEDALRRLGRPPASSQPGS